MRERKGLWTKENTGSEISEVDKRLRRYIGIDAERRALEEAKWLPTNQVAEDIHENGPHESAPKEKEAFITVAEASRRAAEAFNGSGSETTN